MKIRSRTIDRTERKIIAAALIFLILFLFSSCGEVSTKEQDPPGNIGSSYSLILNWTAPTTNEDGSPLQDLAGYKVYYGTDSHQYSRVVTVGSETSVEIGDMGPGTWYVAIIAFDMLGNESNYSNEFNYTFN